MASNGDEDLDGLYSSDEDEWQEKNIRCLVRTRSVEDCLAPLILQVGSVILSSNEPITVQSIDHITCLCVALGYHSCRTW